MPLQDRSRCDGCRNYTIEEGHHLTEVSGGARLCARCLEDMPLCNFCELYCSSDFGEPISEATMCSDCYNSSAPKQYPPTTFLLNKSPRTVGFEFEFSCDRNDVDLASLRRLGRLQVDGSITRSPNCYQTAELATHYGSGDALLTFINTCCATLTQNSVRHNRSCGLHLHISCPDTLNAKRNLYAWWQALECTIELMVRPSRIGNDFCRASRRISFDDARSSRYGSLNISCYDNHNTSASRTFEVRLHHMTLNPHVIKGWTLFLLSFFDTFTAVEPTLERLAEVRAMSHREQLIFIFQQTKAPLSLRKQLLRNIQLAIGLHDKCSLLRKSPRPAPPLPDQARGALAFYDAAAVTNVFISSRDFIRVTT